MGLWLTYVDSSSSLIVGRLTEPFRFPLLLYGTVCQTATFLHLQRVSSGPVLNANFSPFPFPVIHDCIAYSDVLYSASAVRTDSLTLIILVTLIVHVTYLLTYILAISGERWWHNQTKQRWPRDAPYSPPVNSRTRAKLKRVFSHLVSPKFSRVPLGVTQTNVWTKALAYCVIGF